MQLSRKSWILAAALVIAAGGIMTPQLPGLDAVQQRSIALLIVSVLLWSTEVPKSAADVACSL